MNFDQIIEISDKVFGKYYLSHKALKRYASNSNSKIIVLEKNERILGFSIVQIISHKQLEEVIFEEVPLSVNNFTKIGYRKMTAIHPDFRSAGMGQKLFELGQNWLEENQVEVVLTVSWINSKTLKYRKFLEFHDFKPLKKLKAYWRQESLERNYQCASCGAPPCHCNGILYAKFQKS